MMRFKYSITLWIEENGLALFVLPPAIVLTIVADEFNTFSGGLYYFINVVGFIFGYILGLVTWLITTEWMRKRTLWSGEWENKYSNSIFPIRLDGARLENSTTTVDGEQKIDKEEKWKRFDFQLSFDGVWHQRFLYFCVSLILLLKEYALFKEIDEPYSVRVFLDSFSFFMAFMYLSKPVFRFVEYVVAMAPRKEYTYGSFWHKFFLFRVLIINSVIYGLAAYYSHQLFFTFE
jgi:hypothetical protein